MENTRATTPQLQNFRMLATRNENGPGNDTISMSSHEYKMYISNCYIVLDFISFPGPHARRRSNCVHSISHPRVPSSTPPSVGTDQEGSTTRVYVNHNHAQRRLLDRLINHGCIATDLRTWEEVQTVWMLVPVKNGGGLGVGLQIEEVIGYVKKNARKHWHKEKEGWQTARRTWTEWVESHRNKVRSVVNNAGPRVHLEEEIVWNNTANGAAAPNEDAGTELASGAPAVLPPSVPLMGELVLKFREINSEDIDPGLVNILYEDDTGRIIHPLGWREGFGIYGPDRPLPCHSSPHSYPMKAMPTSRATMSTISIISPQPEPPLYPLTVGIVTIKATVARGYETPIWYHMLACAREWGFGMDLTISYPFLDEGEVRLVARVAAPWERNILSGMEAIEGLLTAKIQWA
ncbi:hypothetical protein L211DRAFT_850349 [Terfezia boudieri ATCC MYA-4762]|uniref:Uncharacterized protein n=1 Tax=Terfezia boudieri ATCC MYA-4762 TaxID=1051890 RepID=A0A3N4LQM9_9PEZI|nr:hypothetical protein L211DRAFT_850349 [Terfezia boudieri ATCC MYA-4762]